MSIIAVFQEMGISTKVAKEVKPDNQTMKKAEGSGGFASARNEKRR
ncbi:MAG: hypothetical protein U0Y10_07350 [Spirosomataceae bacterium]